MAEKRLRYAFIGDADSLLRSIRKSDTALGKFSRSVGKVGSAAVTGFGIVGAAATAAGLAAIKTASDATEAGTAFEVTFGDSVKNLTPFIDDFANKAGLASFELQDLLKIAEEEANKVDISDESKYLADQKVETLKSLN